MRAGKTLLVTVIAVDIESVDSVHTLEFLKAIEWYFTGTSDELEQFCTFFLVEGTDSTPEPLDLGGRRRVVVILSVDLPVVHINLRQSGNQQLKFLFSEDGNEVRWDNFMEA